MLIGPLPQWRSRRRSSGEPSRLRWRRTLTSGMGWRDDEATTLARPTIVVDSYLWKVYPAGRITVYGKDEFGLLFELGTGPERKRRFTRYSPLGSKSTDASLAELTERQLLDLFHQSQPAWTSPEGGYGVGWTEGRRNAPTGGEFCS